MFTGIVEEFGRVRNVIERDGLVELHLVCSRVQESLSPGESVAVNGCCQTVVSTTGDGFSVEVMPQTMRLTTLGELKAEDGVNLERALKAGDRLGGHWVQGHVDGVAEVVEVSEVGADRRVCFRPPRELTRYLVERGSVAVDGISLTVAVVKDGVFEVALIPTTLQETTAGSYQPGQRVNLEVDILARYLERLMETSGSISPGGSK